MGRWTVRSALLALAVMLASCRHGIASTPLDDNGGRDPRGPLGYQIGASVIGGGTGTISPSGITYVLPGGSQSYSISASGGSYIADVTVDGTSVGAVSSYNFTSVAANHAIVANIGRLPSPTALGTFTGSASPTFTTGTVTFPTVSGALYVGLWHDVGDVDVNGMTWNGHSLSRIQLLTFNGAADQVDLWYYGTPAPGEGGPIVVDHTNNGGSVYDIVEAVAVTQIASPGSPGARHTGTGSSTSASSGSFSGSSPGIAIAVCGVSTGAGAGDAAWDTYTAIQSQKSVASTKRGYMGYLNVLGAGSVTATMTLATSAPWGVIGAVWP